ncbi:ATP-binding protein [Streptomyces europaeiscabiei]|uniref:ATP-binding protein n=1 Tax=Streptomyces europaeiscabiei TaxID=146819 RepID=UPI002E159F0D|nr:tetratricopeptide repeat protein [Streptomyces europaeiscabiei]
MNREGSTGNHMSGTAHGVVQGRDFYGGVHLHTHGSGPSATPRHLPPEVTHFTGRREQLAILDSLLGEATAEGGQTMMVSTLSGMPGVGKTALAVHWAHGVRDHFPGGDLYMDLRGYGPGLPADPSDVLESFLWSLGVPPERVPPGPEARSTLYRTLLDGRRTLVVLDNARSAEQVRPLLPGAPGSMVVVTSRSLLSGLAARDGARRVVLDVLPAEDATDLLRKISGVARSDAEPEATPLIARYCAYLPLALRIAAERAAAHPQRPLSDLARELTAEHDRLDAIAVPDDEISEARTVFSWSYRNLRSQTAQVFRLLALSSGASISGGAAAALTGMAPQALRRQLETLVGANLLREEETDRYRFHDLLRAYARERAVADEHADVRKQAVRRMLLWYAHTANAARSAISARRPQSPFTLPGWFEPSAAPVVAFADSDHAMRWCDAEAGNLVSVVQQAADEARHDVASWLPVAFQSYFQRRMSLGPWITTHAVGVTAARAAGDEHAEAELHRGLGGVLYYLGRCEESYEHHRLALERYRRFGWPGEILLVNLGSACAALGRYEESLSWLRQALAAARETGYRNAEAYAFQSLGSTYQRMGQLAPAADHCREAVAIFRETGDRFGANIALGRLALACLLLGRTSEGTEYLHEALTNARQIGDHSGEAWALETLGTVSHSAGRGEEAYGHWRNALTIYQIMSDHSGAARIRTWLAAPEVSLPDLHPRL